MTFKNISSLILILALLAVGIYWLVTRPTPQEKGLENFLDEFRKGHYIEAQEFTVNNEFYEMAIQTSVRDTDGSEYMIRDYFPEPRKYDMQYSVETYVRFHIARWKYISMSTEDIENGPSVVHFRLEISIRDTRSSGLMGDVHDGRIEGNAYMVLEEDHWVVDKIEISIFSDDGFILSDYLSWAGQTL